MADDTITQGGMGGLVLISRFCLNLYMDSNKLKLDKMTHEDGLKR